MLPFENLSEDKESAFFADGVQDDILTALSKVAALKVTSRTSVNTYPAGTRRNLREIGQTLGVAYVLEGSVRRDNEKAHVTAQLIDARTDARMWTQSYDRDLPTSSRSRAKSCSRLPPNSKPHFHRKRKPRSKTRPTKDLAAYGLYVRAKALIATISFNAQINDKLRQAVQLLDQAIARDPDFSSLLSIIRRAQLPLFFGFFDHTPARLALADSALKAVVRLRPEMRARRILLGPVFYTVAISTTTMPARSLPLPNALCLTTRRSSS